MNYDKSMALTGQPPKELSTPQKFASVLGISGLFILLLAEFNVNFPNKALWLTIALSAITFGTIWFSRDAYGKKIPGIKNDGVWFKSISSKGFGVGLPEFCSLVFMWYYIFILNF